MSEKKILLVDDEPTIVELCSRFLGQDGYVVKTAPDGSTALELFKQESFDLVLTDIRMRGMSGLELIDSVKKIDQGIAIVVMTGHGTITMAIESLKLGTLGFVIKPFTREEILTAVRHATEKNTLLKENIRLRSLVPLLEINRKLTTTNLDNLFNQIVEIARKETLADRASLMLLDEPLQELRVCAHTGFPKIIPSKLTRKMGEGVAGTVAKNRIPLMIQGGVKLNPKLQNILEDEALHSSISVPLIGIEAIQTPSLVRLPQMGERLIGVLNISKDTPQAPPFSESDLEFVTLLADQVATSIEKAKLYQELHSSYVKTIRSLVATVELKDSYTAGHSENVSRYCVALAREMGLSASEIDELSIGGILHDIGKIGSSEDILLKESKLSEEETQLMQKHPQNAVKVLSPVGLSDNILKIILHHHEHCNGKGYPHGLKRDKIPVGARIIMVADTIDAMTSDRPYRKAQSVKKLLKELQKHTGPQFDADVVAAFERLVEKKGDDFFRHH